MSHTPHELADEFPEDHAILHRLKMEDHHYAKLADRYHEVNGEIHRIEAGVETPSDDYTEKLKKKRLALLDEISAIVTKALSVYEKHEDAFSTPPEISITTNGEYTLFENYTGAVA